MTAFSGSEMTESGLTVTTEIRSYNGRHLDIALHLPHDLHPLEDKIRKHVSDRIARGHISVRVEVKKDDESAEIYNVDTIKASAYYNAISQLKTELGLKGEIPLDLLLMNGDIILPVKVINSSGSFRNTVSGTGSFAAVCVSSP